MWSLAIQGRVIGNHMPIILQVNGISERWMISLSHKASSQWRLSSPFKHGALGCISRSKPPRFVPWICYVVCEAFSRSLDMAFMWATQKVSAALDSQGVLNVTCFYSATIHPKQGPHYWLKKRRWWSGYSHSLTGTDRSR